MSEEGAESCEECGAWSDPVSSPNPEPFTHSHGSRIGTSPLERGDERYLSICLLPAPSEGPNRHIERERESESKRKGVGERERESEGAGEA